MLSTKEVVLSALEKDINRRYISAVSLQADGRLELDSVCVNVLSPSPGEKFYIINDNSSIIIARKPLPEHEDKVISQIVFGSGSGDKTKWRLRLPQVPLRILLACKVGFRAFRYGDAIALEAEPYIPSLEIDNVSSIEELAPFVLRSARSILHIDCVTSDQAIKPELNFRLLGEYWIRKYHQDPLDTEFKLLRCAGNNKCVYCEKNFIIVKTVYWFPVVGYHLQYHYARPSLLSFKIPATTKICSPLIEECENWALEMKKIDNIEKYCDKGTVVYDGKKLFKLAYNSRVELGLIREDQGLSIEEKGLMKIALKELEGYIDNFDGVKILH